ncbi:hypothetical protein BC941DRAFT_501352 [Chlamydoabsidia padenii]|nr:hypothetical protein BC941DRAFT_501352 [Chlamydoabsidia padenii]
MSLTINVSSHESPTAFAKKPGFEYFTDNNADTQHRHRHRHHSIHSTLLSEEKEERTGEEENENYADDDDDDIVEEDGSSSMSSSPSIPDENINFDLVYALHTFTATVEGQASVLKGDALVLMEDTNIYWWLVEVLKTREIGYIPAENIETPYERLARLNKHRNVEITSPFPTITITPTPYSTYTTKRVTIAHEGALATVSYFEVESDLESELEADDEDQDDNDDDGGGGDDFDICTEDEGSTPMKHQQNNPSSLVASPQSMVQPIEQDSATHSTSNQQLQHGQQKQRPRHYLNSAVLNGGFSSHSLSSDGSFKRHSLETHNLRVFAGNIGQGPLFHTFQIKSFVTTEDLLKEVIKRFDIVNNASGGPNSTSEYYIAVHGADGYDYILGPQDKPLSIFKTLTASLTTPMPIVSQDICRKPQEEKNDSTRRKRSSSFGNHEQTNYEEDSVIRFYVHRRVKRTQERQGLVYIKVSLYPGDYWSDSTAATYNYQQQQIPLSTTTSTSNFFFKSKKTLSTDSLKTEVDRLDKTLPVSYDSLVRDVINTALEKFHIPNAEADGMPPNQVSSSLNSSPFVLQLKHQTKKYSMTARNGCGQETLLCATDTMADVLHDQQHQQVSDLLFIIRQSESTSRKSEQQLSSPLSSRLGEYGSNLTDNGDSGIITFGDRQPSVLSILTNYSSESIAARHTSLKGTAPVSIKDQRRCKSLTPPAIDKASSLASWNSGHLSSSTTLPRSRQITHPNLSTNSSSGTTTLPLTITINKRHGYISKNGNTDIKKRKERSSFKQQLKRLVSWGSFISLKQKSSHDSTIVATRPDSTLTATDRPQLSITDTQSTCVPSDLSPGESLEKASPTPSPLEQWQHLNSAMVVNDSPDSNNQRLHLDNSNKEYGYSESPLPESIKTNNDSHISGGCPSTASLTSSSNSGSAFKSSIPGNSIGTFYQNDNDDDMVSSSGSFDNGDNLKAKGMIDANVNSSNDNSSKTGSQMEHQHLDFAAPSQLEGVNTVAANSTWNEIKTPSRGDFDDDLLFLVTQGVDYLKAKECTKWDDEDWHQPVIDGSKTCVGLEATGSSDYLDGDNYKTYDIDEYDKGAGLLTTIQPTGLLLDSDTIQPQDNDHAIDKPLPATTTPKESSVNDEELHWIVNSHILF